MATSQSSVQHCALSSSAALAARRTRVVPRVEYLCQHGKHSQRATRQRQQLHQPAATAQPSPPVDAASASPRPLKRLAVFVSGGGSNFRAIHSAILSGRIEAEVAVVVSNTPSCGGVAYAQEHGIPTLTFPASKSNPTAGLTPERLVEEMQQRGVDYIILAGYMKLIPKELVRVYHRAMLNIHPGFGGKGMYGLRVHSAVIASGARISGPTVHFVDEEYDTGPILAQAAVEVLPTDTPERLAARVLAQEHQVYPRCVAALVEGRITWREDGVPVAWSAH